MTHARSLTELLEDVRAQLTGDDVTVGELIEAFHERGFGFFLFLFALPAALPLPAVGYGTLLALPLLLLTAQQAYGRHTVWLPASVRKVAMSRRKFEGFIDAATPWLRHLEVIIRPRLPFVTDGFASNVIGVMGLIMALSVCIPLPLTNTVPSFGIGLMAIGLMMRDGLAVLAGAIIGTAWVAGLVTMVVIGADFVLRALGL